MRHFRLLSQSVIAMLLLRGIAAAAASATKPTIVPAGTAALPLSAVSKSSGSIIGSGFDTDSSSASTGTESFTSEKNGTFSIKLTGTKDLLARKCTGLSDTTEGTITISGAMNARYANRGTKLVVAILYLLNEVHFSCGMTLAALKGCVAGVISEFYNTKLSTMAITLTHVGPDNEIIKVFNEADTKEENCELLASQSEGTFELSAADTKQELSGFKQSGKATEVEVMF